MTSPPLQNSKNIIEEIKANFSVVYSTLELLDKELDKEELLTSYKFISDNIKNTTNYIREELSTISEQAKRYERTCVNSPLQISFYKSNPGVIFSYRNNLREFSDQIRRQIDNLSLNIGKSLAAYILVYETLEKFGFKVPFILIESNEFTSRTLINYIFSEFDALGSSVIKHKRCDARIITYSGMEISNPLSLLIIGHETFHIINEIDKVFHNFCELNSIKKDKRTEEAFVDIMSNLYFGPVYSYTTLKYFQKTYPLSGESHPEMSTRLLMLSYLNKQFKLSDKEDDTLNNFINTLERRMSDIALENARKDKKQLDNMISKNVESYIREYFNIKGIATYDEFKNIVEEREFNIDIEKINRNKIIYMLNANIPLGIRPTTLLNTLYENNKIDNIDPKLIVSSFKKWYVRRYYHKHIEIYGNQ